MTVALPVVFVSSGCTTVGVGRWADGESVLHRLGLDHVLPPAP